MWKELPAIGKVYVIQGLATGVLCMALNTRVWCANSVPIIDAVKLFPMNVLIPTSIVMIPTMFGGYLLDTALFGIISGAGWPFTGVLFFRALQEAAKCVE